MSKFSEKPTNYLNEQVDLYYLWIQINRNVEVRMKFWGIK